MDIRFNNLQSLHWLWLVLAIAMLLAIALRARSRALRAFASHNLLARLSSGAGWSRRWVRAALLVAGLMLLVAALIDPRWGMREEVVQRKGKDILFAVDVSRSMLAEDAKPNRLERAKQYVSDVIDEVAGDRVGLISFAGVPAVKCPLTVDYGAFRLSLNELEPESAARGGSLLGDALRVAADSFTDEVKDYKLVIILSDGEDQGSYVVEAAKKLLDERGIRTFTVGLGDSADGARIPVIENGRKTYLTYQGQEVWTKMDGNLLREVALAGGGAYVPAGTSAVDMGQVYREKIASAGSRDFETNRIRIYNPQYQWFAGAALLLLLIESWMSDQRPSSRRDQGLFTERVS